jgi:putative SOS response-associated peptidase YedK
MCGRYSITLPPEAIRHLFQTHGELPNWPAYYNAAPTTALPVVRQAKQDGRKLVLMQWGLIPWFSKDGKPFYSTINARAEGIRTAASYREPFAKGMIKAANVACNCVARQPRSGPLDSGVGR